LDKEWWGKGNAECVEMGWRAIELPPVLEGSGRNVRWWTLSTYIKAFGGYGDKADGKYSPFIHKLQGNRDVKFGAFSIGHAFIGPQSIYINREHFSSSIPL
jgi:hypothetical protein